MARTGSAPEPRLDIGDDRLVEGVVGVVLGDPLGEGAARGGVHLPAARLRLAQRPREHRRRLIQVPEDERVGPRHQGAGPLAVGQDADDPGPQGLDVKQAVGHLLGGGQERRRARQRLPVGLAGRRERPHPHPVPLGDVHGGLGDEAVLLQAHLDLEGHRLAHLLQDAEELLGVLAAAEVDRRIQDDRHLRVPPNPES